MFSSKRLNPNLALVGMSTWVSAWALALALALCGVPAMAQKDGEPAKDHPNVPRFPGMMMSSGTETDFDGFDFEISADNAVQRAEGRSWEFEYNLKEGARRASALEVIRNYAAQFSAHGGKLVYQAPDSTIATMKMPLGMGSGERWLRIQTNGETINMRIIETGAMVQKVEFTASEMAAQAALTGRVILHGILFDSAKSEIKPASTPLLDEVAAMIKAGGGLKFKIEGHTDNVGTKAANGALSKGRAVAIKTALVARGIDAARLSSDGMGDSKPVADNTTEEGRRLNRRVELVKQ